jgi:hypothetical protein
LEQIASISSYFVRPLQSTSPTEQEKIFHRTVQDFTLSLASLFRMYSVLVIRPRLNCTQVEMGLHSKPPPPPISSSFVFICSWWLYLPTTLFDIFKCLTTIRETENTSRDFITVLTEGPMQDVTVARVQKYRLPPPPSIKCNVLCESLSEDSRTIPCEGNL